MKITFITYIYPYPNRGYNPGIERVVEEFSHELAKQGHEIHVITTFRNGGTKKFEVNNGIHIHRASDTRQYFGKAGSIFSLDLLSINITVGRFKKLLDDSDIVHAFTPIVWKPFTTPLVAHYHHWDEPTELLEYLYLPTSHQLWLRCYNIADRVIAVSEYSAGEIIERGINSKKTKVIHNGVDTDVFYPGSSSIDFEQWDNTLLYVGPLSERKGIQYLIEAIPDIVGEHESTGLVIVGGGDNTELLELVESLEIHDSIRFEGFVPDDQLPEYYRSADLFVFPSLLEGFGMVLLEAMASGLPIVSTQTTAIPEVVGDAGELVPPKDPTALADAIIKILSNGGIPDLKNKSLQRVRSNYTWNISTQKLLSLYTNL